MLTLLRNLLRSKIALVLIGLLILSLAVWGVTDIFRPSAGNNLVKIGTRAVSVQDVSREIDELIRQQRESGNTSITRERLADSGELEQFARSEIDRELIAVYLENTGMRASKAAAADAVRESPLFINPITGSFDTDSYEQFVDRQGLSDAQFSSGLRDDISRGYIGRALQAGLDPTAGMNTLWTLFNSEQRRIAYFAITPEQLAVLPDEPTEEELRAFYDENRDALLQPDRRALSAIILTPQDFITRVDVTEEELQNDYEAQISRFSGPSTRTFDQLTFTTEAAARAALGPLLIGEELATVLNEHGGRVVPAQSSLHSEIEDQDFAQAVFNAPLDIWDGPVEIGGMFRLIRVTEDVQGEPTSFVEVRETIESELLLAKAERAFDRSFEEIDDAIGAGLSLEEMSNELGSPVFSFPPVDQFGRTENGQFVSTLAGLEGAMRLAFNLFPDETSNRRDDENAQYILRLDEVVEQRTPSFEEVREDLAVALRRQKLDEALQKLADESSARISEGTAFITAEAEGLGVEVTRPLSSVRRTDTESLPQTVLLQIFNTERDKAFVAPLQIGYVVGVVEAIEFPDPSVLPILEPAAEAEIRSALSNDMTNIFSQTAISSVDAQFNAAQLQAYIEENKSPE